MDLFITFKDMLNDIINGYDEMGLEDRILKKIKDKIKIEHVDEYFKKFIDFFDDSCIMSCEEFIKTLVFNIDGIEYKFYKCINETSSYCIIEYHSLMLSHLDFKNKLYSEFFEALTNLLKIKSGELHTDIIHLIFELIEIQKSNDFKANSFEMLKYVPIIDNMYKLYKKTNEKIQDGISRNLKNNQYFFRLLILAEKITAIAQSKIEYAKIQIKSECTKQLSIS